MKELCFHLLREFAGSLLDCLDTIWILILNTLDLVSRYFEGFDGFGYLHAITIKIIKNKLAHLWFDDGIGIALFVCKSRRLVCLVVLKA